MFNLFVSANIFETLGFSGWSILFYLLNLLILVGGIILLLYRPVKKMLKAKREKFNETFNENQKLKAESEKLKTDYEKMVDDLKVESARIADEVYKKAQQRADSITDNAHEQAKSIVDSAKKDALYQKEQLKNEYKDSVNRLAVQVAQKLLEREITQKDNDALIEQVLSDWEDDD